MMSSRSGVVLALSLIGACSPGSPPRPSAATPALATPSDSLFARLRQQVTNGSIVADAQLGKNPPMAVGACLNPVAAARLELERALDFPPDVPPVVIGRFDLPALPESLREPVSPTGIVVARWVVDTNGVAEPSSASIVSSPHGLLSVRVCGAIFLARFTPATEDGRRVRARVEMPVRVVP
jgi:hypothetical protein